MLPDDRDAPERMAARSAQDDPWVMYLIVRSDRVVAPTTVYTAAARATVDCVARHRDAEAWREGFAVWSARSFRKVTLRAKGSAWDRLAAYDHGADATDDPMVRVLPPRQRSVCDALVRNLQVYNPDRAALPPDGFEAPPPDAMRFAINPAAVMSVGKTAAQVSHAVLMCAWSSRTSPEALERWARGGYACAFVAGDGWEALRASDGAVVVRDAGLTEVTPGTETVAAVLG